MPIPSIQFAHHVGDATGQADSERDSEELVRAFGRILTVMDTAKVDEAVAWGRVA